MCSIYRILINNSTELSLQIDELIIHFSTRISWMNTNRKVNSIQTKNRILEAECNLSLIQFEGLVIVHCYYVMLHLLKALDLYRYQPHSDRYSDDVGIQKKKNSHDNEYLTSGFHLQQRNTSIKSNNFVHCSLLISFVEKNENRTRRYLEGKWRKSPFLLNISIDKSEIDENNSRNLQQTPIDIKRGLIECHWNWTHPIQKHWPKIYYRRVIDTLLQ